MASAGSSKAQPAPPPQPRRVRATARSLAGTQGRFEFESAELYVESNPFPAAAGGLAFKRMGDADADAEAALFAPARAVAQAAAR